MKPMAAETLNGTSVTNSAKTPPYMHNGSFATLEDVIEPYLIQEGFLQRTNRGRIATRSAYLHFGIQVPAVRERPELGGLFE